MVKLILWLAAILFGILAHQAAMSGGVDQVSVGFGLAGFACVVIAVNLKTGGKKADGKKAKAKAAA